MSSTTPHIPPQASAPPFEEAYQEHSENKDEENELSRITANASFSVVQPAVQGIFEYIDDMVSAQQKKGHNRVLEMLANNIALLQDCFMEVFYSRLIHLGINTSIKVTLRLDNSACLVLASEHPDARRINALLIGDDELTNAFVEIAAQSAALRDLKNLQMLSCYERTKDGYTAIASGPGECIYQMSLKGEMSHFYFTR